MPPTVPTTVSAPSSSYTSQDYSYFSPQTPFTSPSPSTSSGTLSVPTSPFANADSSAPTYSARSATATTTTTTTTTTPGGPIIISTITLRNNSHVSSSSSAVVGSNSHPSSHSSHQSHTAANMHQSADDVLHQFALHIPPPPPTLSLSLLAQRNPSTTSSSPSVQSRAGVIINTSSPQMSLSSTPEQHTLSVQLPRNVQPEMVTISANKGDRLRVVADAWGGGNESHYEWQISFPPHDVDMGAVHARFDPNGRLTLEVKRKAAMRARYY